MDNFLRSHGVKVKTPTAGFETMSVEDLMRTKESIEDLIAEKEQQEQSVTVEADAAVNDMLLPMAGRFSTLRAVARNGSRCLFIKRRSRSAVSPPFSSSASSSPACSGVSRP